MKTSEIQKSNSSNSHSTKPFFNKSVEGSFFSQSKETEEPFFSPYHIQTKLTIGQPNDKYEQEADIMAEKVVQKLENPSQSIQRKCEDCEKEEKLQMMEKDTTEIEVMRKPIFESYDNSQIQTKSIESQLNASKGKGKPLTKDLRSNMETAFGVDFSSVKIHTDSLASTQMNNELGAKAFTHGNDIYFSKGEYSPSTIDGKKLLAHELTHTIQQKNRASMLNSWVQRRVIREDGRPIRRIDQFHVSNSYPEFRQALIDFIHPLVATERQEFLIDNSRPQGLWSTLRSQAGSTVTLTVQFIWGANRINRVNFIRSLPPGGAAPAPSPMPEQPQETQTHADNEGRQRQVVCVRRLGGCANTRPGGIPTPEEITTYNQHCRPETHYLGPDVTPTGEECRQPPTPPQAPEPMEVTVVDDSDYVGWAASATRIGEVYMADTSSMVTNVLAASGQNPISRLNILDHGNPNGVQIGNDWITMTNVASFVPVLSRLRGHFTSGGFVHFQHCNAGQNLDLMRTLAAAFGVPVYAGTGAHNPVYRFNFGEYVRCDPDGTCARDVGRP